MFETQSDIVESLLQQDNNFSRIHNKYSNLKTQIDLANQGKHAIDDLSLEQLKKEKLHLKDKLADMITDYQRAQI